MVHNVIAKSGFMKIYPIQQLATQFVYNVIINVLVVIIMAAKPVRIQFIEQGQRANVLLDILKILQSITPIV